MTLARSWRRLPRARPICKSCPGHSPCWRDVEGSGWMMGAIEVVEAKLCKLDAAGGWTELGGRRRKVAAGQMKLRRGKRPMSPRADDCPSTTTSTPAILLADTTRPTQSNTLLHTLNTVHSLTGWVAPKNSLGSTSIIPMRRSRVLPDLN